VAFSYKPRAPSVIFSLVSRDWVKPAFFSMKSSPIEPLVDALCCADLERQSNRGEKGDDLRKGEHTLIAIVLRAGIVVARSRSRAARLVVVVVVGVLALVHHLGAFLEEIHLGDWVVVG
jgi:hypothetical protein